MKTFLENENALKPPKTGDIVEGKVIGTGSTGLFVDLGVFGAGVIYKKDFNRGGDVLKDYKEGTKIFVKVTGYENEEGYLELSFGEAQEELAWKDLREIKDKNEDIKIMVSKANKGGLIGEIAGISGFLPLSQLSLAHYPRVEGGDSKKIIQELQKLINQTLEVKIFDLDPRQKKLIFSEKARDAQNLKETLKSCKLDDIVEGEITGITDFGLFLKFSLPSKEVETQLEGLIHISEIEKSKADDIHQSFKVGQAIKARIIKIEESRVYLSLKGI